MANQEQEISSEHSHHQFGVPRPYRSHRVRACDACRQRKSRCTVDIPGQSCLLCRLQGIGCQYLLEGSAKKRSSRGSEPIVESITNPPKTKRPRRSSPSESQSAPAERPDSTPRPSHSNLEKSFDEPAALSAHIVGPIAAHDAQVLEQYMAITTTPNSPSVHSPYNVYSDDPVKPVLYTKVSRQRVGSRIDGDPGSQQKEILEQVLGPFTQDLLKIYFERINPAFPIFQEHQFFRNHVDSETVSKAILCQICRVSNKPADLSQRL